MVLPWWFLKLLKSIWCPNRSLPARVFIFLLCFLQIEGVLVLWRAVSVQALDNILFDGAEWLTRPHLSPRPLLLSSPHTLPCSSKHTSTHRLHPSLLSILPPEDSASCLCYWTGYHITAGTAPDSHRIHLFAFSEEEIMANGVWGETLAEGSGDKSVLKMFAQGSLALASGCVRTSSGNVICNLLLPQTKKLMQSAAILSLFACQQKGQILIFLRLKNHHIMVAMLEICSNVNSLEDGS